MKPETLTQDQVQCNILEKIYNNPQAYHTLDEEYQSDPEVCLLTLLEYECDNDHYDEILPEIFQIIFSHVPHFADHLPAFFRFVELGIRQPLEIYLEHFPNEIYDHDILEAAFERDRFAALFQLLPEEHRSNPELLAVAVESVLDSHAHSFLQAVPWEALVHNEFILFQALERDIDLTPNQVPPSLWTNRSFLLRWIEKKRDLTIATIPRKFSNDREICLLLYQNLWRLKKSDEFMAWIAKQFLADKEFVLKCLSHDKFIYEYCDLKLKDDFDVVLAATFQALPSTWRRINLFSRLGTEKKFHDFINGWAESLASRVIAIRTRLEATDEFMTFLACSWKSHQLSILPLNTLDCDNETVRGLNTMIAGYLGFYGTGHLEQVKRVWEEIMFLAVDERWQVSKKLQALLPPKALVQGILKTIQCGRTVSLETFPEELWSNN
jgi:hypothetical protein